jgi:hypothetical protein
MTLVNEIGQGQQEAYFSVYGVFGWKKEIRIIQKAIHFCVQSERMESCNKQLKERKKKEMNGEVWWQNLKEKDVTAIGWEGVNWSRVGGEREGPVSILCDRLGMPSRSMAVVSFLGWLKKCWLLKKHSAV